MGIIGKPYQKTENGFKFEPIFYYSHSEIQKIYYNYANDLLHKYMIPYEL